MLHKIQSISLKNLLEIFEQDSARVDVMLCSDYNLLSDIQIIFEDEKLFSLVTLEEDDLHDQRSILEGLHQVFFDDLPGQDEEAVDIIEAVEDELGELQNCLLIVEDFSLCHVKTQAALLELAIVSRAFKLLLKVDDGFDFSENEQLWNVLAPRSRLLDNDDDVAEELFIDDVEEEEVLPVVKLAWYQMIPKYHLVAGLFLLLLVFSLWNMDISQKKEQVLDLDLHKKTMPEESPENHTVDDAGTDNLPAHEDNPQEEALSAIEAEGLLVEEEAQEVAVKEAIIDKKTTTNKETGIDKTPPEKSQVVVPQEKVKPKPVLPKVIATPVIKAVDWSPYQSNTWIKGLNNKSYTLQLMASHDDQGIRNFLRERGVSSQYAVYTSEKNGKPWHVIIYGVYENHEFADLARKDLPTYLKDYSPWVRSIADVQSSLK